MIQKTPFGALAAAIVLTASASASAQAAGVAYFDAGGTAIQGDSQRSGYVGWHDVNVVRHEIVSPRDAASGLPTGRRQHKPIVVRMPVSNGTPGLVAALIANQSLTVQLVTFSSTGETVFTIDLMNASIASYRTAWSENGEAVYEIQLSYQRITYTSRDGSQFTDDWESPVI